MFWRSRLLPRAGGRPSEVLGLASGREVGAFVVQLIDVAGDEVGFSELAST